MSGALGELGFYAGWLFGRVVRGRRVPLNSSVILTDRCNLDCRHFTVTRLGRGDSSLEEIRRDLGTLHGLGSRMLVITGGEPFLWRDDAGARVEDVVRLARAMGFFRTVVCTNGTYPLESEAEDLWVSLDGSPAEHEAMRGGIYSRVRAHIESSTHPRIHVNFTISRNNWRARRRRLGAAGLGQRDRGPRRGWRVLLPPRDLRRGDPPPLRLLPAAETWVLQQLDPVAVLENLRYL